MNIYVRFAETRYPGAYTARSLPADRNCYTEYVVCLPLPPHPLHPSLSADGTPPRSRVATVRVAVENHAHQLLDRG